MKKDTHPAVYKDAVITCACGSSFITFSTNKTTTVEICSACHPFYTGQQKFVDTEGRIDKFAKKVKVAAETKIKTTSKRAKSSTQAENVSLKDLLKKPTK